MEYCSFSSSWWSVSSSYALTSQTFQQIDWNNWYSYYFKHLSTKHCGYCFLRQEFSLLQVQELSKFETLKYLLALWTLHLYVKCNRLLHIINSYSTSLWKLHKSVCRPDTHMHTTCAICLELKNQTPIFAYLEDIGGLFICRHIFTGISAKSTSVWKSI